jgi:hypothetical protein
MVLMRQLSDRVKATSEAFGKATSSDARKRLDDFNEYGLCRFTVDCYDIVR